MTTRRTRWLAFSAIGVAAIAIAVWVWPRPSPEPRGQARPAAGQMEGMPGMENMPMGTGAAVEITPEHQRAFGITFGTAEQRPLADEIRATGSVVIDETRIVTVAPRFGGFVERLYVDFTGRPVTRGQPLLEIYSPELVSAQEELLLALRLEREMGTPHGSSELARAARQRLRAWDISDAQIDEVIRTGEARRTIPLHAPASGVVIDKPVTRGQSVQAGEKLYSIADLSRVWVEAELREADAAAIRVGALADVELTGVPGRSLRGRVEYVYPTIQSEARTLKARISVPNPDGSVRPGMFATVRLRMAARSALTVPASAVINTGQRTLVFVDLGGGRFKPQEIIAGRTAGEFTEVISGVEPGQRVVTSAQFLLDSESNLAEVMKSMIAQMGRGAP